MRSPGGSPEISEAGAQGRGPAGWQDKPSRARQEGREVLAEAQSQPGKKANKAPTSPSPVPFTVLSLGLELRGSLPFVAEATPFQGATDPALLLTTICVEPNTTADFFLDKLHGTI